MSELGCWVHLVAGWDLGLEEAARDGAGSSSPRRAGHPAPPRSRERRGISKNGSGLRWVSSPSGAISFSSHHRRDDLGFLHFLLMYLKLHWVTLGLQPRLQLHFS